MIIALFGGDGRAVGTHAAVLLARAAASADTATTLVRVANAHEAGLPHSERVPDRMRIVELCGSDPSVAIELCRATAETPDGHLTVLDLPQAWLAACPVDLGDHEKVVAVGPTSLDGSIVASALRGIQVDPVPWLLVCGAASVRTFGLAMRELMNATGVPGNSVRVVDRGLPGPRQDIAASGMNGRMEVQAIRAALEVLDIIAPGAARRTEHRSDPGTPVPPGIGGEDRRAPQDRLRDLADALDAAGGGEYPSAAELACAPLLEDWEVGLRPVSALVGRVTQHPGFPAGRLVRTSEVYASDRRTWARTYSRLYRLGRPAGPRERLH
ncbi:DUF6634 family protein [Methylobacterium sp. D54C]